MLSPGLYPHLTALPGALPTVTTVTATWFNGREQRSLHVQIARADVTRGLLAFLEEYAASRDQAARRPQLRVVP